MSEWINDFRVTFRVLKRRPLFSLTIVLTFAAAMGACTAVFTVVNAVLLRAPAYRSPQKLALVFNTNKDGAGKVEQYGTSVIDFLDWRDRNQRFSSLAAFQPTDLTLTGSGDPEQVEGGRISANLFDVLGIQPFLGRFFRANEETDHSGVAIISYDLWLRRFGGADVIGQPILVDGTSQAIVGIAPKGFFFSVKSELWLPLNLQVPRSPRAGQRNTSVVGRLKPGVTVQEASSNMAAVADQLEREFKDNAGWGAIAVGIREPIVRAVRQLLVFLFGTVAFLLLIACANIANLILVRSIERQSESVLRVALGGTRGHLLRQTFLENAVLTLSGSVVGVFFSVLALRPLIALSPVVSTSPAGHRLLNELSMDSSVCIFALGVSLMVAGLLSLIPYFWNPRHRLHESLKSGALRSTGGRGERRIQQALVVAEIAVSLLLLAAAGMMLQSYWKLKGTTPGFQADHLLTARITLPASRYETSGKREQFLQQAITRISSLPGVISASGTSRLPLNAFAFTTLFKVEGIPSPEEGFVGNFRRVGPNYFKTMQTTLLEGREFNEFDVANKQPVAIVSREMAQRYWPRESAIGRRIQRFTSNDKAWRTIVGVVEDVKDAGISDPAGSTLYVPYLQGSTPFVHLVLRCTGNSSNLAIPLQKAIASIDKDLALSQVLTGEQLFSVALSRPRFAALLLAIFAALGLFIATIGVYGVLSYSTTRRFHEIGIRMALGAEKQTVLRMVMLQSLRLTVLGISIGGIGFQGVSLLSSSLWPLSSKTSVFIWVPLLLLATALTASLIPALKATRVDPSTALRYE